MTRKLKNKSFENFRKFLGKRSGLFLYLPFNAFQIFLGKWLKLSISKYFCSSLAENLHFVYSSWEKPMSRKSYFKKERSEMKSCTNTCNTNTWTTLVKSFPDYWRGTVSLCNKYVSVVYCKKVSVLYFTFVCVLLLQIKNHCDSV